MKIKAYFVFPEKDREIIDIIDNPEAFQGLINDIVSIKKQLRSHNDFEMYYDSKNVDCFLRKTKDLLEEEYLFNQKNQILNLFGSRSRDVSDYSVYDPQCVYVHWNYSCCETTPADKIILEASEASINEPISKTILINIANACSTDRDAIHVIKDAIHVEGLPIMISTPIVSDAGDFVEWYALVSDTGFTLKNKRKFKKTASFWVKQRIYKCLETGRFWYFDFYHKENKKHYEVFDSNGDHLGEADENGGLKEGTSNNEKSIRDIIQ